MTAVKQQRVMSLHQTIRGSTKDYGTVGLQKSPKTQRLVFPKSLRSFSDRRVIAINYDLLGSSHPASARDESSSKTKLKEKKSPSGKSRADVIAFSAPEKEAPTKAEERPSKRSTTETKSHKRPRLTWKTLIPGLEAVEKKLRAGQTEEASSLLATVIADVYATAKPKGSKS